MLGNGAYRVNLRLDIRRTALPIAAHASRHIDKVVRMAESVEALGDLLALGADALELLARRLRFACGLLSARRCRWGVRWPLRLRLIARTLQRALGLIEPLLSCSGRCDRRPLLGGQGT